MAISDALGSNALCERARWWMYPCGPAHAPNLTHWWAPAARCAPRPMPHGTLPGMPVQVWGQFPQAAMTLQHPDVRREAFPRPYGAYLAQVPAGGFTHDALHSHCASHNIGPQWETPQLPKPHRARPGTSTPMWELYPQTDMTRQRQEPFLEASGACPHLVPPMQSTQSTFTQASCRRPPQTHLQQEQEWRPQGPHRERPAASSNVWRKDHERQPGTPTAWGVQQLGDFHTVTGARSCRSR